MFDNSVRGLHAALVVVVSSALIATVAFAQGFMVNAALLMDDGLLTMLDTHSSGLLSADEYGFFRDRLFDQNDADHNGSISAAEYAKHASDVFADMDADRDGFLTKEEVASAHSDMLRFMYKNPNQPDLAAANDAMIAQADTDHDGRISAQEYTVAMKARFDEMDTNQNGVVSQKEFSAVHYRHKPE